MSSLSEKVKETAAGGAMQDADLDLGGIAQFLPFDIDPRDVPASLEIDVTNAVTVPSDGYRPLPFNGPKARAQRFHNFPRGGNTNDIVSLTRFAKEGYESENAREYLRGIVVVSIVMALIYVLWAVVLLLLRASRLGECRCCCFRGCGRGMRCVESTRARGGCLARNLCGWMSGRVPKKPTKASLIRDEKMRRSDGVVKSGVKGVASVVSSAKGSVAKAVAAAGTSSKDVKEDSTQHDEEGGGKEADINDNDDAQAEEGNEDDTDANDEANDGTSGNSNGFGAEENKGQDSLDEKKNLAQDEAILSNEDEVEISDEYVAQRRRREERSMTALRCFFLLSGLVVLSASIALCIVGFRALHDITNTAQDTLAGFDDYFGSIVEECDSFLNRTEVARARRNEFLEDIGSKQSTNSTVGDGSGAAALCPSSISTDGTVAVDVNLGRIFDGPLLKLAEITDKVTGEKKITVVSFLEGTKLGAAIKFDFQELKEIVDKLANRGRDAASGIIEQIPDNIAEKIPGAVEAGKDAVENVVDKIPEAGLDVIDAVSENIPSVVEEGKDAIGAVTEQIPDNVIDTVSAVAEQGPDIISEAGQDAIDAVTDVLDNTQQGENRRLQEEIVDVGGDMASLTIIGNATAYKERDLSALLATNFSFTLDVAEMAERANAVLESSNAAFVTDKIIVLRDGSELMLQNIQSIDSSLESVTVYWYIAVIFASFLMLLVVLMMIGCILAWISKQPLIFKSMNDCVVLPIFIFLGMLIWIFTCVFLCLALLSGDLCVVTPSNQIYGMLENILQPKSQIAFNFASYYLGGCLPEDRPLLLDVLIVALVESRQVGAEFFNILSNLGPGPLGRACGSDFNFLRAATYLLSVKISASLDVIFSLGTIILCRSFHPLYSALMYRAMCTDIIDLISPMFVCLIIIAIFSMVMVSLRVAWHELEDDLGDGEEKGEQTGCHGCGSCRK